jgi:hypothetical protein
MVTKMIIKRLQIKKIIKIMIQYVGTNLNPMKLKNNNKKIKIVVKNNIIKIWK